MFRRLSNSLPKDVVIPADLTALGYFINQYDQIRQISHPDQKYHYQINRSERINDIHKEAMNGCIRKIVIERLETLNLEKVRLPIGASPEDPHVPILVSKNISLKKRIVVIFGERHQDLGIFSYRVLGNEMINKGSAVDLVTAIENVPGADGTRGIIIANPGQLLWYRGEGRAITHSEWTSLPRKSAVHDAWLVDPVKNTIPGNRDYQEHVQYVFEHVMRNLLINDVKFELVGLELTGQAMVEYLAKNWRQWAPHVEGICLGSPQHTKKDLITNDDDDGDLQDFAQFFSKRCRAYFVSSAPSETFLTGREEYGCNCYASGEPFYQENIIIASWRSMLDWFNLIESSPSYEEEEEEEQAENIVEPSVKSDESDEEVDGNPPTNAQL